MVDFNLYYDAYRQQCSEDLPEISQCLVPKAEIADEHFLETIQARRELFQKLAQSHLHSYRRKDSEDLNPLAKLGRGTLHVLGAIGSLHGCGDGPETSSSAEGETQPYFTSEFGNQEVLFDDELVLDFDAVDPQGYNIFYTLISSPEGSNIDPISGIFTWKPSFKDIGRHSLTVRVENHETWNEYKVEINVLDNPAVEVGPCKVLQNGTDNIIDRSTTICPGEYRAHIIVNHASGIYLRGEGVRFHAFDTTMRVEYFPHISIVNSDHIEISGFTFTGGDGISLVNSSDNEIRNIDHEDHSCGNGIEADQRSHRNLIINSHMYGPGAGVSLLGDDNEVRANTFENTWYCDIITGSVVWGSSSGNTFSGNEFKGVQLFIMGDGDNLVISNRFSFLDQIRPQTGELTGVKVAGSIFLNNTDNNTVRNNEFIGHTVDCIEGYGNNNQITNNIMNTGLQCVDVQGSGNIIQ